MIYISSGSPVVCWRGQGCGAELLLLSLTHSCLTLCDPMDCSLLDSSVHEISQARIMQ